MTAAVGVFLYLFGAVTDRPPYRNTHLNNHRGLHRPWPRFDEMVEMYLIFNPNPTVALTLMSCKNHRNGHVMRSYITCVDYHTNRFVEARPSRKHYCQSRQLIAVFFTGGSFCSLPAQYYTCFGVVGCGFYHLDLGY